MPVIDLSQLEVRLARDDSEILASQKLRYRVFVEEFGAKVSKQDHIVGVERDQYDDYCDHLILLDNSNEPRVVGTIRLLSGKIAEHKIGFYSASEYTLDKLITDNERSLEISRACVDKDYRQGVSIHLLWLSLAKYIMGRNITLMFGVASFRGSDPSAIGSALTYLVEKYSAPKKLGFRAKAIGYINMNIVPHSKLDQKIALNQMPSLLKAYLRMGARIADGAFLDTNFNTIDVGLMMMTESIHKRYKELYTRPNVK